MSKNNITVEEDSLIQENNLDDLVFSISKREVFPLTKGDTRRRYTNKGKNGNVKE